MNRQLVFLALIVMATVLSPSVADAQPPLPGTARPTFSPFLNLARQGGTPALNYYGLVRPEMQFNQSLQNLQGAIGTNQQAIGDLQAGGVPATGHATQFLNYGGYFLNNGAPAVNQGYGVGTQTILNPPSLVPRPMLQRNR
jgi:hypothetical protein